MKNSVKTVLLLVNPQAGRRQTNKIISSASRHFNEPDWKLLVKVLTGPEEAYMLAREAARKGKNAVLVAGGDGTINEVARALIGKKTALGVIPAGTGNGFARGLKIPLNIDLACERLRHGRQGKVDAAALNGDKVFVNVCGTGYDAWAARKANKMRWLNKISGFLRYASAGTLTAFEFKAPVLKISVDRQHFEGPCIMVCVANGEQFGFGAIIAPGASLNDGKLDVLMLPPMNLIDVARNGIRMFTGKPLLHSTRLIGKKIVIESMDTRETPMHVDGEYSGNCPARIKILPNALNVLIP